MLRVNVGISRKLTKDYNSTGFSVNLEGEISAPLDEPEMVIEKVREYYDLADEALRDQIERYTSTSAIADRDTPSKALANSTTNADSGAKGDARTNTAEGVPTNSGGVGRPNGTRSQTSANSDEEKATNKQVQFLLTLAKRQGLTLQTLEAHSAEILGRRIGTYDLTKRQAGQMIESLHQSSTTSVNDSRAN